MPKAEKVPWGTMRLPIETLRIKARIAANSGPISKVRAPQEVYPSRGY